MYILMTLCGVLLVSTIAAGIAWQDSQEDLHQANSTIDQLKESQQVLTDKIQEEQTKHKTLEEERKKAIADFQQAQGEIAILRKNKGKVVENPKAAEAEIQISTDQIMRDIQCLTGDKKSC